MPATPFPPDYSPFPWEDITIGQMTPMSPTLLAEVEARLAQYANELAGGPGALGSVRKLSSFAGYHGNGATSDDTAIDNANIWLAAAPYRAVYIEPVTLAMNTTPFRLTGNYSRYITDGFESVLVNVLAGSSLGTVVQFGTTGVSALNSRMDGISVNFANTPASSTQAFVFKQSLRCSLGKCYIVGGAAGALAIEDNTGTTVVESITGRINYNIGGIVCDIRSGTVTIGELRLNGGDSEGNFKGGQGVRIQPPAAASVDTIRLFNVAIQGGEDSGPETALHFDFTQPGARHITNVYMYACGLDHYTSKEIWVEAPPGSEAYMQNVNLIGCRFSADAGALLALIDWQSTKHAYISIIGGTWNHGGVKRPICISSATNNIRPDIRVSMINDASSGAAAPDKTVFTFGTGDWRVDGPTIKSDSGEAYLAGGETDPRELWRLIVDAGGGTFPISKAGGGATGALAYNISAASLQTALETLYGAGNVEVEGGIGGVYGPPFRARLQNDYVFGTATMPLVGATAGPSASTSTPGDVRLAQEEVHFTGWSGTVPNVTLLGCTGGSGLASAGTVVQIAANAATAPYFIRFKGIYLPTALTAPGFGPVLSQNYTGVASGGTMNVNASIGTGMLASSGSVTMANGDTLTYTGKTNNTLTGVAGHAGTVYLSGTLALQFPEVPAMSVSSGSLTYLTGGPGSGFGRAQARIERVIRAGPVNNFETFYWKPGVVDLEDPSFPVFKDYPAGYTN